MEKPDPKKNTYHMPFYFLILTFRKEGFAGSEAFLGFHYSSIRRLGAAALRIHEYLQGLCPGGDVPLLKTSWNG